MLQVTYWEKNRLVTKAENEMTYEEKVKFFPARYKNKCPEKPICKKCGYMICSHEK